MYGGRPVRQDCHAENTQKFAGEVSCDVDDPYPIRNHWCLARHRRIACHGYVEARYLDAQEKTPGLVGRGFLFWLPLLSGGEFAEAVSPMRSLATRSLNAIQ